MPGLLYKIPLSCFALVLSLKKHIMYWLSFATSQYIFYSDRCATLASCKHCSRTCITKAHLKGFVTQLGNKEMAVQSQSQIWREKEKKINKHNS